MGNESNSANEYQWYNNDEMQDSSNNINGNDYSTDTSGGYIPPESQPPTNDDQNIIEPKKETKPVKRDSTHSPKIGEVNKPMDDKKGRKNLFQKIFGKKPDQKNGNDY